MTRLPNIHQDCINQAAEFRLENIRLGGELAYQIEENVLLENKLRLADESLSIDAVALGLHPDATQDERLERIEQLVRDCGVKREVSR